MTHRILLCIGICFALHPALASYLNDAMNVEFDDIMDAEAPAAVQKFILDPELDDLDTSVLSVTRAYYDIHTSNHTNSLNPVLNEDISALIQNLPHIFGEHASILEAYYNNKGRNLIGPALRKLRTDLERSGWDNVHDLEDSTVRTCGFWMSVLSDVPVFGMRSEDMFGATSWEYWSSQYGQLQTVILELQGGSFEIEGQVMALVENIWAFSAPENDPSARWNQALALLWLQTQCQNRIG